MKFEKFKGLGPLALVLLVGFLGCALFLGMRDVYTTYSQARVDAQRTEAMWQFVGPIMQQQLAQRQAQQQVAPSNAAQQPPPGPAGK